MENYSFAGSRSAMRPLDEIASLLQAGQKLNAIKVYREVTGASLSDAKTAVERMELAIRLYGTQVVADALSEVAQLTSTTDVDIQSVLLAEMAYLISQGQKLQAIKLYRERTGLGLIDAKNVVDRIEQMLRASGYERCLSAKGCSLSSI